VQVRDRPLVEVPAAMLAAAGRLAPRANASAAATTTRSEARLVGELRELVGELGYIG
jgi:hypothetical protein